MSSVKKELLSQQERPVSPEGERERWAKADNNRYWRSFAELEDSPEFLATLADEFPEQAEDLKDPLSRRRFFQLMGASLALAGIGNTGCRWEEDHIVPLSRRPDNYVPGVPKFFATSMEMAGFASALVARSFDGRPIKLEGNEQHPASGGKSTTFQQASLLHLYDPDRSKTPTARKPGEEHVGRTFEEFDKMWSDTAAIFSARNKKGEDLAILTEASYSPTVARLRAKMAEEDHLPKARWFTWEPINLNNQTEGLRLAFGAPHRAHYIMRRAQTILALDCDFLGNHPGQLRYAAEFATRRDPEGTMNRLYAVESAYTTTGASADHRLPLRSELIKPFLLTIEAALLARGRYDYGTAASAIFKDKGVVDFTRAVVSDLSRAAGRSLICVGDRQPPDVHAIAARINEQLGAVNSTVVYTAEEDQKPYTEQLRELVDLMNRKEILTLVILGGNPVYDAPADLEFGKALEAQRQSIHLSMYRNETSMKATWHVPRSHYLEEWGDGRTYEGVHTIRQPLIRPLFGGRSALSILKHLTGDEKDIHADDRKLVAQTMAAQDTDLVWRKAVQSGFLPGAPRAARVSAKTGFGTTPLTDTQKGGLKSVDGKLEVTFLPSSATFDGRFANNAWLQEVPDYMTKLTWGNAALIAPSTAADLGINNADVLKITIDGRSIEAPAYVMPGQAPSSIGLTLGYGREHAGVVAGYVGKVDSVGFNAYPLRTSKGLGYAVGASVEKTGGKGDFATTQDHWAMDTLGRKEIQKRIPLLVKESTVSEYSRNRDFVKDDGHTKEWARLHSPKTNFGEDGESFQHNLFKTQHEYDGHKWGMTIDLGKCIGCNSCTIACQAENNIPVVGKEQVKKNREMHWIRIDRYFAGDPNNPRIANQPVHCQQCENAPCEQVCPVGATLHSTEGLNDMVYNRCVGTRYCANNCPYKVRRFNFHHWNKPFDEARNKIRELLFNPEVTVRSRGVMEKCTWCVQRISAATIKVRNESVTDKAARLKDGDIQTACQQACPTNAIVFGDLNDEKAKVTELQNEDRAYLLLADLNNRPRNAYLAKIRNPNPALEPRETKSAH